MSLLSLPRDIKCIALLSQLDSLSNISLSLTAKEFSAYRVQRINELRKSLITETYESQLSKLAELVRLTHPNAREEETLRALLSLFSSVDDPIWDKDNGVYLSPLALTASPLTSMLLIRSGADVNHQGESCSTVENVTPFSQALDRFWWKVPLLEQFGLKWGEHEQWGEHSFELNLVNFGPLAFYLISRMQPRSLLSHVDSYTLTFDEGELIGRLPLWPTHYPLFLHALHNGLDLRVPAAKSSFKTNLTNSNRMYFLYLALCYGLNLDTLEDYNYLQRLYEKYQDYDNGLQLLELLNAPEQAFVRCQEPVAGREWFLSQKYHILAYLQQKEMNPYWNDEAFWIEKWKRDYPNSWHNEQANSEGYRQTYLRHYDQVILIAPNGQRYPIPSPTYGRGFVYGLSLSPPGTIPIEAVEAMGQVLFRTSAFAENGYKKLLLAYTLCSSIKEDHYTILPSGSPPTLPCVFELSGYRLQAEDEDFALGFALAKQLCTL